MKPRKILIRLDPLNNSVLLDTSQPPFDGSTVLVKFPKGWCEAWWCKGYWTDETHASESEFEGHFWVCMDDDFQQELEDATHWMPLPESETEYLTVEEVLSELEIFCADTTSHQELLGNVMSQKIIEEYDVWKSEVTKNPYHPVMRAVTNDLKLEKVVELRYKRKIVTDE